MEGLEAKVEELIALCEEHKRQRAAAEAERDKWRQEGARLQAQNARAKSKVEAMLVRLKALKRD